MGTKRDKVSRRAFLRVTGLVASALALRGLGEAAEPTTLYLPLVAKSTLAAWGFAKWGEFTWG